MNTLAEKVTKKIEDMGIKYDAFGGWDYHLVITNEEGTFEISIYFEEEEAEEYTIDIKEFDLYEEDTYYNKKGDVKRERELLSKEYKSIRGLNIIKKYI